MFAKKSVRIENKAFKEARITGGTVTYKCPICGGEAVENRYLHGEVYHRLGSDCKTCEMGVLNIIRS